jgi:hypothetical protein
MAEEAMGREPNFSLSRRSVMKWAQQTDGAMTDRSLTSSSNAMTQ